MPTNLPTLAADASFDTIVQALEDLTRTHGLTWRLGIGAILLDGIFAGDLFRYHDRSDPEHSRLSELFRERLDRLSRVGISERMGRTSIRALAVWRTLPEPARDQLLLGQLDTLASLGDPTARLQVATAALRHGWTQEQLVDAVAVVRGGGALDVAAIEANGAADSADDAGVDGTSEPEVIVVRHPGRLVTEAEKWTAQVDDWARRWQSVDPSKFRAPQRQRLREAIGRLEQRLAVLKAGVGG